MQSLDIKAFASNAQDVIDNVLVTNQSIRIATPNGDVVVMSKKELDRIMEHMALLAL